MYMQAIGAIRTRRSFRIRVLTNGDFGSVMTKGASHFFCWAVLFFPDDIIMRGVLDVASPWVKAFRLWETCSPASLPDFSAVIESWSPSPW